MLFRLPAAMRSVRPLLVFALLLGGCTVGPDFQKPSWMSPSSWSSRRAVTEATGRSEAVSEPIDPQWWNLFQDRELTSLEERVAAANLDVRAATVRLAKSRAQRGIAAADQFPSFNGNGSYTREKISNRGAISLFGGGAGSGTAANPQTSANGLGGTQGAIPTTVTGGQKIAPFNLWQYGFDASWELDLWGRVRRSIEAADASVEASGEARRNTLLTSLAEVARDYIQLRGTQTMLQIARDNLKTAQESLQLTQQRAQGGVSTDLDVANASAELRSTAAEIPQLRAAGGATDQRAQSAARAGAERATRRIGAGPADPSGPAPRAGRPALGTGPPPPRYSASRGAAPFRDG